MMSLSNILTNCIHHRSLLFKTDTIDSKNQGEYIHEKIQELDLAHARVRPKRPQGLDFCCLSRPAQ
jgi:hypothetical protein